MSLPPPWARGPTRFGKRPNSWDVIPSTILSWRVMARPDFWPARALDATRRIARARAVRMHGLRCNSHATATDPQVLLFAARATQGSWRRVWPAWAAALATWARPLTPPPGP